MKKVKHDRSRRKAQAIRIQYSHAYPLAVYKHFGGPGEIKGTCTIQMHEGYPLAVVNESAKPFFWVMIGYGPQLREGATPTEGVTFIASPAPPPTPLIIPLISAPVVLSTAFDAKYLVANLALAFPNH